MSTATPQKFEFQAEIAQLLDIVTHSLYTEKEIFVRELVSNASDALEKLRHTQLTEKEIQDDKLALEINLTTDDQAKTLTIQDYGIGMTRAELVENLGTIAHSGSKAFLKALGLLDLIAAGAVARPDVAGLAGAPGAGVDLDGLGHHEGGVEADAELADETGAFLVVFAQGLQKGLGA